MLPHLGAVADDLAVIRSMYTEAINHDPRDHLLSNRNADCRQTEHRRLAGLRARKRQSRLARVRRAHVQRYRSARRSAVVRPTVGLWISSHALSRVKFRNSGDPVSYLSDPAGIDRAMRREMLDELAALNRMKLDTAGDPEIATRIAQYELAFRMQASVPELADISQEPQHVLDSYGPEVSKPGTYAFKLPAGAADGGTRSALHPTLPHGLGSALQPAEGHRRILLRRLLFCDRRSRNGFVGIGVLDLGLPGLCTRHKCHGARA
jgi:hypothetical protein